MKTRLLQMLVGCFFSISCAAQDNTEVLLHIPAKGKTVNSLIPKGFRQAFTEKGDFNRDGKEDKVVVLEAQKPRYGKYPGFDRLLLILLRTKDGWNVAGKSATLMLPADLNNDPMLQVDSKGNTLEIHQISYAHVTLTSLVTKFQYRDGDFYLVHKTVDTSSIQHKCEKLNEYRSRKYEDINYITGVRVRKKISYYCELLMDKTDTINVKPIKLSEVKTD